MAATHATFTTTTGPAKEPITLSELKSRLRLSQTATEFDGELRQLLKAAVQRVEEETARRLLTQTVALKLDDFPVGKELEIRLAPIQSLTSIQYIDTEGATQTVSSSEYHTDLASTPPRVWMKDGYTWPTVQYQTPNAVTVTFQAGYDDDAANLPQSAILAVVEAVKLGWRACADGDEKAYQRHVNYLKWTRFGMAQ